MKALRTLVKSLVYLLVGVLSLGLIAWGVAAIWFDGPAARWAAGAVAACYATICLSLPILLSPFWRACLANLVPFGVVLGWWLSISPANDRDWLTDVARLPRAEIQGSQVTIHNVRSFDYHSGAEPTERWETRTYDLDAITGLDLFIFFWGPTLYGHTIMSWEFGDGKYLPISIETRKEKGEEYSAVKGFFRQYELYYVVADERDVVEVRTNHRGEQAYLYCLKTKPAMPRALLLEYLEQINRLAEQPRWYNAFTHNCTTTIFRRIKAVSPDKPWDWRLLANGYLPELGHERGSLNSSLPLAELKERSNITERAKSADTSPDFSRLIREGLPERPGD